MKRRKRFALVIGAVAAGVMTLGAQTAAAATYNTRVTITQDRVTPPHILIHGDVRSAVRKCEVGRRVVLFEQQPGTDRMLGATRSSLDHGRAVWGVVVPQSTGLQRGDRLYAKAPRKQRSGYVCRADRSKILLHPARQ